MKTNLSKTSRPLLHCLLPLLLLSLAVAPSQAQTSTSLDPEFGGRIAFSADKKLLKGLHLNLEEEIRFADNFSSFNRLHTTLDLSYKLNQHLKLGIGYALINPYDADNSTFKSSRHRFLLDATGAVRLGNWRLSLKERLQGTYRSGDMNTFQSPRFALALKSRIKVQYKGLQRLEPSAGIELRNTLNSYAVSAYYDGSAYLTAAGSQYGDEGWFIAGRSAYVNRLRGSLGLSYRIDKRSSFELTLLADYVTDRVIDANAAGTKLKSYSVESGFVGWLTAGYNYSF